jgi:hypothetical protein
VAQILTRQRFFCYGHIFPLIFPSSELVGMNHRSLPDARMLFHLTDLLCTLFDPPKTRDFSRFTDLGFAQGRVMDTEELTESEDCEDADVASCGFKKHDLKRPPNV